MESRNEPKIRRGVDINGHDQLYGPYIKSGVGERIQLKKSSLVLQAARVVLQRKRSYGTYQSSLHKRTKRKSSLISLQKTLHQKLQGSLRGTALNTDEGRNDVGRLLKLLIFLI